MTEEIKETTSVTEQIENRELQNEPSDKNLKELIEEKLGTKIPQVNQNSKVNFKENIYGLKNLLERGFINEQQGQNLLNHIIRAALDSNVQNNMQVDDAEKIFDKSTIFKEFDKVCPNFFEQEGRSVILDYLKSDEIQFDKDELSKISKIVEAVEKSAIDRYLKKVAYEKNLEKFNSEAKQRLKSNIQKSNSENKNFLPFTREQIGKMTNAEYLKNEDLIMDQLKKGLIK